MAKGDDAVRRKKNKVNRKRMRSSDSAVSARIASIIASKKRRKSGKRRTCEGMCFSLPTPEDPFNDRHDRKNKLDHKLKTKSNPKKNSAVQHIKDKENEKEKEQHTETPRPSAADEKFEDGCLPKFLTLCLNAIENSWKEKQDEDVEEEEVGNVSRKQHDLLASSSWGAELWRRCSSGWNVVDSSSGGGVCARKEQLAWLLSTASDIIARKEKQGLVIPTPFLIFLVPSRQRALQVRSLCKPLKALGIHTVSLHPGASIDHQIQGLKSCEPEFLVSTPDRLLELVQLKAIDVSSASLLVLDGLKSLVEFGFSDKVKLIKESISREPQMVVFSDFCKGTSKSLLQQLLNGPVCRLSLDDSAVCKSAFVSQHLHVCSSEDEKMSKASQILSQAFVDQNHPQHFKVLLVAGSASNVQLLASKLKAEGYGSSTEPLTDGLHMTNGEKVIIMSLKDMDSIVGLDVEEFEIVIFLECPSTEVYVAILKNMARYCIAGAVHCLFSKSDASLAQPLIKVLEQCDQAVPESLKSFDSS
ncbi:uncharacterized protein A4U43_C02F8780 [Asparagus officinalis]|uniref:DEAD/DEAH-box helicase domain-containing protein n=1 Tax=Asparagus officinalis TaxID=4686 RepID=A0A5P1FJQ4_ASPOF|nr:ATP-dependent RNA helicase DBP3 [Asparagus officinalis]ONK77627.1 uncharacterized protein A4U43_C02F8780 [Asparagus officinalis]